MKYIDSFDETEVDIDGTVDFTLDDMQIQDLIKKLLELEESKESVEFEVNDIAKMIIHHPSDPLLKMDKEENDG